MTTAASSKKNPRAQKEFPRSLIFNVVIWLLALSLLPVLAIGIVTYLRTRAMLTNQANAQLQVVIDNYINDLEKYGQIRRATLENMVKETDFSQWIDTIKDPQAKPTDLEIARYALVTHMQSNLGFNPDPVFNEIFLVDAQGEVLAATNSKRYGRNFLAIPEIQPMIGKNRSEGVYNVPGLFTGDFTWLTSLVYESPKTGKSYTFIGAMDTPLIRDILIQGGKYMTSARVYLFSKNDYVVGLSSTGDLLSFSNNREQMTAIKSVLTSERMRSTLRYTSYGNNEVLAYARWHPDLEMGLALEVPENVIYDQLRYLGPFYMLVLIGCLVIAAISLYFGASNIVSPILKLVEHVRAFAQGDFTHRAAETRKDEIGLLAHSFNQMADQLSQMYRALETKVEERNTQLYTAAELAQVATSSTSREEIMRQTVNLVTERFNYDYACVYLLESSGNYFTDRYAGGRLSTGEPGSSLDLRIRAQSAFGVAIHNNQASVIERPAETDTERPETLLQQARSEVIIPITAGSEVLGILDVQSALASAFEPETVSVLKMLATQVANGLQNIRLLESAKVDLQETNLLYRASRQITQVDTRDQISQILCDTIAQTPYVGLVLSAAQTQLRATALIDSAHPDKNTPVLILTLQRVEGQLIQNNDLLFENLTAPGEFHAILDFLLKKGCCQAALLPVKVGGKVVQVIALGSRKEGALTEVSLQPYLNLVEVIANTEERFNMLENLEDNLAELRTVTTVSEALSVETDPQVLFTLLYEQIIKNIGAQVDFYVALYDSAAQMITTPYCIQQGKPVTREPYPLGDNITSILIKRAEPLLLSYNAVQGAAALGAKYTGIPARSWVGVPLMLLDQVIGVMVAEDLETDGRFTERELRLFTTLAPQVTVAVRNARLLTDMQQALKAYDQERFLLNALLDKIPDQIYFKDPAGRYIRGSQSLLNQLGLSAQDELIGKTGADFVSSQQAAVIHEEEQTVITTGQAHEGIIEKYLRSDGSEEWDLVSRLPLVGSDGNVTGLLAISRDITGLKQAEELAQKRAGQLRTAAEIARDTSGTLNIAELLVKAVNLIRDRFGFYHASIFLVDALGEYAVLRESTGEAGRSLKEAGHRLAVGSQSIVGQCVARGEALVVNDVTLDPNYYPNPLLPATRSELSMPLKVGERVVGALDVQSTSANAFLSDSINILQILADQLAIAIVNADLFLETQENLTKHRFLHQITTAAASCTNMEDALKTTVSGLVTALGSERVAIYLFNPDNSLTIHAYSGYADEDVRQVRVTPGEGVIGLVALGRYPILIRDTQNDSRYTAIDSQTRSMIAVPILYSDRTVGVLSIESTRLAGFDENDQEILGSLGNNLGAILSNAQLVSQVRQQIEQQKNLFEITSKIRRSTDVETVMQTSVREICRAMNARSARIQITVGAPAPVASNEDYGSNGNGHRETA